MSENWDKKARSEAQRLQSIRDKVELEKKQKEAIRLSLQNVDKPVNNKIVFDDSDDDDDVGTNAKPSTSQKLSGSGTNSAKGKIALFDESDGDGSGEENNFVIENKHSGFKGAKLMEMEAKFQSDDRFKMTDKFVSDGESEDELEVEKRKNRELLSKVLGKSVAPQQKTVVPVDTGAKKIPPRPFTRFDPTNEKHVQWMKLYGERDEGVGKKKKSTVDEPNEEEGEEVDRTTAGTFASMESSFAEELKVRLAREDNKEENNFSFLAMMGRSAHVEPEPSFNQPSLDVVKNDSAGPSKPKSGKLDLSVGKSNFFFSPSDPSVVSVVANFKRTQSYEKTVGGWSTYRDAIMKIYHHNRKMALRKMNGKLVTNKFGERKRKAENET